MSVKTLRKENDELKLKLKSFESELESLTASLKNTKTNREEQEHGVQFLSDEYDDLTADRNKMWDQIKRLSSKLDTISTQVDRISQAIDSFELYSYQYNVTEDCWHSTSVGNGVSGRHSLNMSETIFMYRSRHHNSGYRHRPTGPSKINSDG